MNRQPPVVVRAADVLVHRLDLGVGELTEPTKTEVFHQLQHDTHARVMDPGYSASTEGPVRAKLLERFLALLVRQLLVGQRKPPCRCSGSHSRDHRVVTSVDDRAIYYHKQIG